MYIQYTILCNFMCLMSLCSNVRCVLLIFLWFRSYHTPAMINKRLQFITQETVNTVVIIQHILWIFVCCSSWMFAYWYLSCFYFISSRWLSKPVKNHEKYSCKLSVVAPAQQTNQVISRSEHPPVRSPGCTFFSRKLTTYKSAVKVPNYRWANATFRFGPLTMVVCRSLTL